MAWTDHEGGDARQPAWMDGRMDWMDGAVSGELLTRWW